MLRNLTKNGVAAGLNLLRLDKLVGRWQGTSTQPLVLCYHRVVTDYRKSSRHAINPMLVSTATFEQQLDWIGKHYDFVSVDELTLDIASNAGRGGRARGRPIAVVTFDDGYADVHDNALPILTRKGIPGAVFVVTDTVGTGSLQMHDELYLRLDELGTKSDGAKAGPVQNLVSQLGLDPELHRQLNARVSAQVDPFEVTRRFIEHLSNAEIEYALGILRTGNELPDEAIGGLQSMDWTMLKSMAAQGVTIGSHTKSHLLLAQESPASVLHELLESRRILEERLAMPVHYFAYPDGCFDTAAVRAVDRAGYRCAFTTCTHKDSHFPRLTIPRRVMWEKTCTGSFGRFSPAVLSCQVNGIFDPAGRCQQSHGLA